ncbi:MAG: alpha-1,4-glucan--maltose-1-phosphate maltosyltransferase [Polyangiaceae bacterium]|nr:alpha-1,4-glucan--maltose-1-phosphate maltosyltransferase [Polyangiaceae bacterium]
MFDDPLRTIAIERATPAIDDGRFPIKREVGDELQVEADIFKDGHDKLAAVVMWRKAGQSTWHEAPMAHVDNDRWRGAFRVPEIGRFQYTIEAWTDRYGSWVDEILKKHHAGEQIDSELLEGELLIVATRDRAPTRELRERMDRWLQVWKGQTEQAARVAAAAADTFVALMRSLPDRGLASRYDRVLEVVVDPVLARFGAWYEMFPRSQGADPTRSATFRECEARLPEIRDMGFDVVYLPPVHPIGKTNRKGRNNARKAQPGDPGSPYAIGSEHGGHMAIEPALGTLADFDHFVRACEALGMKVALDFAIQASPDHPYLKDHPEWFQRRPDGTIKYAENPPKKYEDIHHLNFESEAWRPLWDEMARIIEFWVSHGVRIFRVDNPHTKPLPFWKWLIDSLKAKHPDLIFFAEAFTRPKMMKMLGKLGFTMSYTYFTWRTHKHELTEYLSELTRSEMKDYYRGNFFTNTPDILPFHLQQGGRPAFKIRAVLASTLCSNYGIYNGFELCENVALAGREEYANSEKYEFKVWDWNRPSHIKALVTTLNRVRRENAALQEYDNLVFHASDSDDILVYSKANADRTNAVLVVVNLNPFETRETLVHVNPWDLGLGETERYTVHDTLTGSRWQWQGWTNYVKLDPTREPAHVFVIERGML